MAVWTGRCSTGALVAGGGHDLTPIAVLLAAAGLLSATAVALTRETRWADLADGDPAATPQTQPAIT
jgi:hypothetical protein